MTRRMTCVEWVSKVSVALEGRWEGASAGGSARERDRLLPSLALSERFPQDGSIFEPELWCSCRSRVECIPAGLMSLSRIGREQHRWRLNSASMNRERPIV